MENDKMEISDRELIQEYAAGNLDAFHIFYGKYKDSLFTFIKNRSGNEADDIFQMAFIKFIDAVSDREIKNPKSYLFQIAMNLIRNKYRETKVVSLSDNFDLPDVEVDEDDFPVSEMEVKESLQELAKSKPAFYEVLHLHIFEKMTFEEIGKLIQKNRDTAASRYRYAINFLKKKLRKDPAEKTAQDILLEV